MADTTDADMFVTKRNGKLETVAFDKILLRIKKVGLEVGIKINYTSLAMKVIDQLYDKISTTKIDELTAEQCASMSSTHPDYNTLAGRITISNHHRNTDSSFTKVMTQLYQFKDIHGNHQPLVSKDLYQSLSTLGHKRLNGLCDYTRDYLIDYFGFKTLERAYLMKIHKKIVERPQHMWLRVALGIHGTNWDKIVETYEHMSQKYFTHATPTLFNAGTPKPQLSSCYLMAMEDDSIDGIFNTLKDCALISKWAGGIGLHIHNVRATGTHINGTNGTSNGIVPMLKVFNNTAKYVDQCVAPETWIYTTNGPMEIQDVVANETTIFNSNGESEMIQNVLEHSYEGEILHIQNMHATDLLRITPNHPLYVLRPPQEDKLHYDEIKKQMQMKHIQCEFVEAKDVTTDDFMVYHIPTYERDLESITNDDCYMYGILLGNGFMKNDYVNGYIPLDTESKKRALAFIDDYFRSKCVEYCIEKESSEKERCIRWQKNIALPFRHSDLYNTQKEKYISKKWLHLPLEKAKHIVKGLIDIDKCERNEIIFEHTSRILIEGLRYLLLRMGIWSSGETHTGKQSNSLRIPKTDMAIALLDLPETATATETETEHHGFQYDNMLFSRIKHIQKDEYHGTLYDLQMEHIHDYMIHNGVIHNGGGKRNGSFAIYLEPWHADVEMFLQMRKNHGDEELKARDLFYALWVPDLFMERVKANQSWTLMCPHECPGLSDVYGEDFKTLYETYESEQRGKRSVSARDLWFQILDSQMETGTPYLLYKDASNQKSNQKNLGTIKSSNLCVAPETCVLTDKGQYPIYSLWAGNYPIDQQSKHKTVRVWNGSEFSEVEVVKTGSNQSLVEVFTSDGMSLVCTPYHKFFVVSKTGDIITKEAKDLHPDDTLQSCNNWPLVDGVDTIDRSHAMEQGIDSGMNSLRLPAQQAVGASLSVPIHGTLQTKMDWLSGFLEPYVCDLRIQKELFLQIPCVSRIFLQDLKLMLQTCGINPFITQIMEKDHLMISMVQLKQLIQNGLTFYHKYIEDNTISEEERASEWMHPVIKIVKVDQLIRTDDTYCFTEPKQHAGIFNGIRTSQCTEIIEYSDKDETAVCNLASIALPAFIHEDSTTSEVSFDYQKLHEVTKIVTGNLNRIIDVNYYPTPKTNVSNRRHRPIGIGVQGLADVFLRMGLTFSGESAKTINRHIFETIYHASLEKSCEIAMEDGAYETFQGSPASQGILQFDMWKVDPGVDRYDWPALKQKIQTHGLRNSLLLAPMPTASTSQILGYNECIEPITSNIYSRRTIAGEFIMVNKYLMRELLDLGMWNETLKNHMVANNGSIQTLEYIPEHVREKYKTVWEIPMRDLIDMSADRGVYICQSQSLNLWLEDPNYNTMTSMHFYSWSKGLKTGIYYLRRRPRHHAQQFTIEPEKRSTASMLSGSESEGTCEMCSA